MLGTFRSSTSAIACSSTVTPSCTAATVVFVAMGVFSVIACLHSARDMNMTVRPSLLAAYKLAWMATELLNVCFNRLSMGSTAVTYHHVEWSFLILFGSQEKDFWGGVCVRGRGTCSPVKKFCTASLSTASLHPPKNMNARMCECHFARAPRLLAVCEQ